MTIAAPLPRSPSLVEYEGFRAQPGRWIPILSDIARRHALRADRIVPVATGSNLIAFVDDDLVLKLFPPLLRHQYESERATLRHLSGRLSVATPALVFEGEADGWPYVAMTRLSGAPLGEVWGACTEDERRRVLHAIGKLIAEVQSIPPGELADLEPEWSAFLVAQAAQCRAHHARLGLPARLLADVDDYLERTRNALPASFEPVLLTGEYTPDNLLVVRGAHGWELAGLIDFGDVAVGYAEYDLLGPSAFLASGEPQRVRHFLRGFGYDRDKDLAGLGGRLMRLLLLHRYSNLRGQVRIAGWEDRVSNISELGELLWPPSALHE